MGWQCTQARLPAVMSARRGNGQPPVQKGEIMGSLQLAQNQTRMNYRKERRKHEKWKPFSNPASPAIHVKDPRARPTSRRLQADLEVNSRRSSGVSSMLNGLFLGIATSPPPRASLRQERSQMLLQRIFSEAVAADEVSEMDCKASRDRCAKNRLD